MKTHKDLDVWNWSMDLAEEIYEITKSFPHEEKFALTNQLRKSAISVPSNIAEGASRNTYKELIYFLYISLGSVSEIETQLLLAERIGYAVGDKAIFDKIVTIRKMIVGLIKSLRRRSTDNRSQITDHPFTTLNTKNFHINC